MTGWISVGTAQQILQLTYPCEWPYVVIGVHEDDMRIAIKDVMQNRTHTVSLSNTSTGGKYLSLKVLVVVRTEEDRLGIYRALKDHPATTIVI